MAVDAAFEAYFTHVAVKDDKAINGPVWSLIRSGKVSAVRKLLDEGLDPESTVTKSIYLALKHTKCTRHPCNDEPSKIINVAGRTLLATAAGCGHEAIVSMLLEKGARVERQVRAESSIDNEPDHPSDTYLTSARTSGLRAGR